MQELPDGLRFTIPTDGGKAPIEEWKHCLPLDRHGSKLKNLTNLTNPKNKLSISFSYSYSYKTFDTLCFISAPSFVAPEIFSSIFLVPNEYIVPKVLNALLILIFCYR